MLGLGVLAIVAAACGSSKKAATSSSTTAASSSSSAAASSTTAAASSSTAAASTSSSAAASTTAASGGSYLIGLVTDVGKVDDKSFNQSAWEGAQAAAKDLGGKADYIESSDQKDYAPNIKQFLDKKYNVIITVGFALGDETIKQAKANPGVTFIGVDQFQADTVPNLVGLVFPEDKAGFVAGALAAKLTKSKKIAAVLGTNTVPPVVRYGKGFENGAKFVDPKISVSLTYHEPTNAFNDPAWGATTAKQALDNGADVVFGAGGNTGNGALTEVAKKAGAYCIGVDSDQWGTVPQAQPCLVTSAMKLITDGVTTLVKQAKGGTAKGGNFTGGTGLAPYHDFDAKIPADVKAFITSLNADVQSGKTPTGVS
jgi:basic membrane protein A